MWVKSRFRKLCTGQRRGIAAHPQWDSSLQRQGWRVRCAEPRRGSFKPRSRGRINLFGDPWLSLLFTAGLPGANQVCNLRSPEATRMGSGELAAPCGCPSEPPQQQTSIISPINAQLQRGAAQPCRNSVSTRGCRWQHCQRRAKKVAPSPREGWCVRLSFQGKEPPRFLGPLQSFLLPHSHFGTEKPPPIAALRPRGRALVGLSLCVTPSGVGASIGLGLDGAQVPPGPAPSRIWLGRMQGNAIDRAPCCRSGQKDEF